MTYRYIYKITCTTGSFKGKFYYGQHTTDNLDDGYKGSGCKLNNYYKKYPNDYIKEIISFHNTKEELNKAEYDIINPWLNNPLCLNIVPGGFGGCASGINHPFYNKHLSEEHKKKLSESHKGIKLLWITKNNINTRVKEEELQKHLEEGWILGRSKHNK